MAHEEAVQEIERRTGLHVCTDPKPRPKDLDDLLATMNAAGYQNE